VSRFDRILFPLDGSARAEAALRWAHLLPTREIRLLRVCQEGDAGHIAATDYLADVAARIIPAECTVETRVMHGGPAETIVAAAADADLIAMCTQGAGGGGRLFFGSVADEVARHAPVPTLLLRGGHDPISTAPLRRVVVPLDGSLAAEQALPLAVRLARMLETAVHLVTVAEILDVEDGEAPAPQRHNGTPEDPTSPDETREAYVQRIAEALRKRGVSATAEVRAGVPARELLETVDVGDVLVLTTHGRGAAQRWQIGSVAEKLSRQAAAPVALVRVDPH
jgi:nucleotide-binding universal stress UspA family protein